jgi:hypothetical protein
MNAGKVLARIAAARNVSVTKLPWRANGSPESKIFSSVWPRRSSARVRLSGR